MSESADDRPAPAASWLTLNVPKAIAVIVLCGWIAYANSITKAFLLDDNLWILFNDDLPSWTKNFVAGGTRSIVSLTLTANWKLGGFHPAGYHLFNLAVHLSAAVVLFDLLRRTMLLPRWHGRYDAIALPLAFAIALIWVVHPMNTHAVTYIIQRCESLMGLFYLLTIYGLLRGSLSSRGWPWYLLSVASAWLGMGCKEVIVTAPLVAMLFDRVFLAESWGEMLRRRGVYYVGLWLTPAPTIYRQVQFLTRPPSDASAGFNIPDLTPRNYFYSQAQVILLYLRLAVWPDNLCFDYRNWTLTQSFSAFLPAGIPLILAGLASVFGLFRRHWLGFAGAWFFLVLSVSSSFIPLADIVNEYRMYLPLIAVIAVVVAAVHAILSAVWPAWTRNSLVPAGTLAVVVVSLMVVTHLRNEDYRTPLAIYEDCLEKRPTNYKIYNQIGSSYELESKWREAREAHETCIKYTPNNYFSLGSLGYLLYRAGERKEGIEYLQRALSIYDKVPETVTMFGLYLHLEGDSQRGLEVTELACRQSANRGLPHFHRGAILMELGRADEAKSVYAEAIEKYPTWPEKFHKYALARLRGRVGDSEGVRREALFYAKLARDVDGGKTPEVLETLADSYAWSGRPADAVPILRDALRLAADHSAEYRRQLETKLKTLERSAK